MPLSERSARHRNLMCALGRNDVYDWSSRFAAALMDASRAAIPEGSRSSKYEEFQIVDPVDSRDCPTNGARPVGLQ